MSDPEFKVKFMNTRLAFLSCLASCCCLTAGTQAAAPERAPTVTHVGLAAPDVMTLVIQSGRIEQGQHVPYVAEPGDTISRGIHRTIVRGGKVIGALVGRDGRQMHTAERLVGAPLDIEAADNPTSYTVVSGGDPDFHDEVHPLAVYRKSKPNDATLPPGPRRHAMLHTLYLKMPSPLAVGRTYELKLRAGMVSANAHEFTVDPLTLRSESVHVTQIGFRPNDPLKTAYLSTWMGTGGGLRYESPARFSVVRAGDRTVVYEGRTKLLKAATAGENGGSRNHVGADVWEMDFSAFSDPGTYVISVAGIRCSFSFRIADDVWREPFRVSARSLYHQRSGIPLGPPYTDFRRPRSFHPDDGVSIYQSTYTHDAPRPQGGIFKALTAGKTDVVLPHAWGGYMDAGDWDRRPAHIKVSRQLFELYESAPEFFAEFALNIPESGDDLPDLVNEALWCVDFHRRMQEADGGVPSGIESAEHPRQGEASWDESLDIMAFAACPSMSYRYAGVAARAAWILRGLGKVEKAKGYERSALRAFEWAGKHEKQFLTAVAPGRFHADQALACLELYRLTGEAVFHEGFQAHTSLRNADFQLRMARESQDTPVVDAAWLYTQLPDAMGDRELRERIRGMIIADADELCRNAADTAYGWALRRGEQLMWGALSCVKQKSLARAHALTGEEKYLQTLLRATMVGAGANPLNMSYTTGVGHRFPQNVMHVDARISGQSPPPGITVGGPLDVALGKSGTGWVGKWQEQVKGSVTPAIEKWPATEAFWDVYRHAPVCEFTVHNILIYNITNWGYICSRPQTEAGQ